MRLSRSKALALAGCAAMLSIASYATLYSVDEPQTNEVVVVPAPADATDPATASAPDEVNATAAAPRTRAAILADIRTEVDKVAANGVAGILGGKIAVGFIFGNRDGELYRYQKNDFDFDAQVPIASASKLLLGIMAMRMIEAGKVSLDAPASTYFNYWAPPGSGDIRAPETFAYMMAQTAGFNHGILINGCADNSNYTLQQCAQQIYQSGLQRDLGGPPHLPGEVFSYGAQDLQLAAALLEQAGRADNPSTDFAALFNQYFTIPTGTSHTAYLDAGNPIVPSDPSAPESEDPQNPYAAKEGYSTANEYTSVLRQLLHGDLVNSLDTFFQPRTIGRKKNLVTAVSFVPPSVDKDGDWQYALGSWAVCHQKNYAANCSVAGTVNDSTSVPTHKINSSPGLFGWTPWIDRTHNYWALIAMNTSSGDGKAVPLEGKLEALVDEYLTATS